jgi:hypothetical protein
MSERYPRETVVDEAEKACRNDPISEIRRITQEIDASTRKMSDDVAAREAEDERLRAEQTPCPNCGLPLVTEDNHRVLIGGGILQIGSVIEIKVKDSDAVFDGCAECFARPALHWDSMTNRVYELEASKVHSEDRIRSLEKRVTDAVGTLYLRWWVVGLAILAFEVVHFLCYLCVKHFAA